LLVFSYPRFNPLSRALVAAQNVSFRVLHREFRTFAHPPAAMLAVVRARGFEPAYAHRQAVWEVAGLVR
jgi:magnesium-protoporphyrin O-methyltransferase